MMKTSLFGYEELQAGWRVAGNLSILEIVDLTKEIISLAEMNPDGNPVVDYYPKDGKGGDGIQVYQRLFESWLMISTWPSHGFVRINLASCKSFEHNIDAIEDLLVKRIGHIEMKWSNKL